MLSPLRAEQRNRSEEDSSNSDSGSELGPEPETDRYGFFLTDGSTDRNAGPSPALVRQREAKWINIIDQWDRLLLKKTSKVKVQCQKGIPASLRAKCWPLLCGASDQMKQQKDLYKLLDSQPALKHWEDVIERDLDRQFPFHEMFVSKDGHGQRSLFQVLKAYTQYKPEEGYCQAQGPVAAVLLMNMPAEEAFWCLVQICEQYLPGYYSPLLEGVLFDAAILSWVLKRSCPAAHKHLQRHGVEPLMFATDWLMCLFTRHLPFNTLLRVWDLFFCYGVRVLLQVAAVLVHRVLGREDQRKQCCGQMETLQRLRGIREEIKDEEDDFIVEVLSVPLSARDLQRQTQKELERWQKERTLSTFDPRGRCQGYQMAWARARDNMDACERKEREKGNLSVPLLRSASTLSLSPSKWRRGLKANSGEWKSGAKVVRHLSMGAKDDCRNWADLNVKKVQKLQKEDDFDLKEGISETIQETKQNDYIEECKNQQKEAQNVETILQIIVELETEQLKENKEISQTTEERNLCQQENAIQVVDPTHTQTRDDFETLQKGEKQSLSEEPTQKVDKNNTEVDDSKKGTQSFDCPAETDTKIITEMQQKGEKQSLSEEPTQKVDKNNTEVDDSKKGTQSFECPAETDTKTITEMQQNVDTNENTIVEVDQENTSANNLQSVKSLKQLATEAIRSPVLNIENERNHFENVENTVEGDTQKLNNDTDRYLEKHSLEGECQCNESGIGMNEESHTQAEIETNIELTQAQDQTEGVPTHTNMELGQTNSQHHETQVEETEAEILSQNVSKDIELKNVDEKEKVMESAMTDLNSSIDQIKNVENNPNVHNKEETTHCTESIDKQQSSIKEEVIVDLNTQALPVITSDSSTPKRQSSDCSTDEELATKTNFSTFHQTQDFFTDNSQQFSYRSSGDFRVRKSSSSRGSRLARRLSEDLFTSPQKVIISNSPDRDENIETTQISNSTEPQQSPPSFTIDATEEAATQKEQQTCNPPKRFGLFHKFRGEKSKKQGKPKMQVPKILIQDFSDEREMGKVVKVQVDDKLTSRERRRQRREQKRKEKEEEQHQKKEKKLEKEEKRAQIKGKSVQVQRQKEESHLTKEASQSGFTVDTYAEAYF